MKSQQELEKELRETEKALADTRKTLDYASRAKSALWWHIRDTGKNPWHIIWESQEKGIF